MSYTVPPQPAAPVQRPGTVAAASYLLYLIAAIQVIGLFVVLSVVGTITDVFREVFATVDPPMPENAADIIGVVYVVVAVLYVLVFGAGFVTLGILDSKGKNPARIVTWVVAGISLCCFGSNVVNGAIGGTSFSVTSFGGGSASTVDQTEVQEKLQNALPSWWEAYSLGTAVVTLLAAIAVIVLLALPSSNAFFRKVPPQQQWQQPGYPPIG